MKREDRGEKKQKTQRVWGVGAGEGVVHEAGAAVEKKRRVEENEEGKEEEKEEEKKKEEGEEFIHKR